MKLAEMEARFYDLVTARESVAATLAAGGERARSETARREVGAAVGPDAPDALLGLIRGDERLSAVERLDVYAGMYFFRIRDVLRDEYARTAALLGDDAFHNLVVDYLQACRPSHPSLREVGARLPGFLAAHPTGGDRPWLAELARLERARLELYDGPDTEALTIEALRATPPERFGALRLRPISCHALLENRFGVSALWRGEDAHARSPAPGPETLLVWRRDVEVYHRAVDPEEAGWLRRLEPGVPFERICAELGETTGSEEAAAVRAFELVSRWTADGFLRAAA
jgi:hypothetical protein